MLFRSFNKTLHSGMRDSNSSVFSLFSEHVLFTTRYKAMSEISRIPNQMFCLLSRSLKGKIAIYRSSQYIAISSIKEKCSGCQGLGGTSKSDDGSRMYFWKKKYIKDVLS